MLPLPSLTLFLHDLLDKKHALLSTCASGKFYLPQLKAAREQIDGLPPALTSSEPFAEELAAVDARHDGYGRTIWYTTEAALQNPDGDAETKAAARRVREAFIASLDEMMDKYAVEASRAKEHEAKLATHTKDLGRFGVPGSKKATLHDVAESFVAAGMELDALLSKRGDVPKHARAKAGPLAASIVGLAGRLRTEIAKEVERDEKLPRDLETRLFGYWDTLEGMAKSAKRAPAKPTAPTAPTPPAGGAAGAPKA